MRALPVSDWLQVLQATEGDGVAAMQRAVRIENRVAQRGVLSPSPPRDRLTGNAGAMAAWAAQLAVEWADTGKLFKPVEEGGLVVTHAGQVQDVWVSDRQRRHASGRVPAQQLAAADNYAEYKKTGQEQPPRRGAGSSRQRR